MTNYKTNLQALIENGETIEKINKAKDEANKAIYTETCKKLAYAENPLVALYAENSCTVFRFNEKTRVLTEAEKKVKSYDVEKAFRIAKSKATDKNGKALANNDVTIFNDFKIVCALQSFIKKCNDDVTKEIYTFDKSKYTEKDLKLDFSSIMTSETALDKAINNVLKLVNISGTYKKKYNDGLRHFATSQKVNSKGITISDTSVYALMDYIMDCCKDRVAVKFSYMQEIKKR